MHLTTKLYHMVAGKVPESLQREHLLSAKRHINRRFVVVPLDKNPGRPIVVCRKLYHNLPLQAYGDECQFECVADLPTVKQASKFAPGVLYARAEHMSQHFRTGRRYRPQSTFLMVKKKSQEDKGEGLKVRLAFSYFAHPMKAHTKRVGCSLTLLSKKAQALLPTFDMQNLPDIVTWARHTDTALQQRVALRGRRQRERDVRLWELDVKEMFTRLRRGEASFELIQGPLETHDQPACPGVWEAIQLLCAEVGETARTRACTAETWFGLGQDRGYDIMRGAYGEMFTNLS